MAATNVLKQATGTDVRSAMSTLNFDGGTALAAGDTIGISVATNLNGTAVDTTTVGLFTVPAGGLSNHDAVAAMCEAVTALLDGATVYFAENAFDEFIIHAEAIAGVANNVTLSSPVVSVA